MCRNWKSRQSYVSKIFENVHEIVFESLVFLFHPDWIYKFDSMDFKVIYISPYANENDKGKSSNCSICFESKLPEKIPFLIFIQRRARLFLRGKCAFFEENSSAWANTLWGSSALRNRVNIRSRVSDTLNKCPPSAYILYNVEEKYRNYGAGSFSGEAPIMDLGRAFTSRMKYVTDDKCWFFVSFFFTELRFFRVTIMLWL